MTKNSRDAVVVAYGRSPMARANKGSFANMHPVEYGGQTLKGVLDKLPNLKLEDIDDVVIGCSAPEKETGYDIARLLAQRVGLPDSVPGQTMTRFCASGLQSIATAANAIKSGEMDVVIAGGIEKMSGMVMGHPEEYHDPELIKVSPDIYISMGMTAENVAAKYNVSREEMEIMAEESHRKAYKAQQSGKFDEEIISVEVPTENGTITVTQDEGIRPTTTREGLAQLKPCFKDDGVVTAATSSQMTDGASFVILMSREYAETNGFKPIARFISFAVAGVPAGIMGIGPIAAVPKVMKRAGLSISDMDVIELNEAFASQAIVCIRELGLPTEKVNPNGGAMALGHPLGATGSFLTCKILSELKRISGHYGLVTMCIGTGMGAAGIYEIET